MTPLASFAVLLLVAGVLFVLQVRRETAAERRITELTTESRALEAEVDAVQGMAAVREQQLIRARRQLSEIRRLVGLPQ